jgi:hypothetical protein
MQQSDADRELAENFSAYSDTRKLVDEARLYVLYLWIGSQALTS